MSDFSPGREFELLVASPPFSSDCSNVVAISLTEKAAVLRAPPCGDLADMRRSRHVFMSIIDLAMRAALLSGSKFQERGLASSIRIDFFEEVKVEAVVAKCSVIECEDRYVGTISINPETKPNMVSCIATCTFMR